MEGWRHERRRAPPQEDSCIKNAVKPQEEFGFVAITAGEFCREKFHVDFLGKIKNVSSSWDFDAAVKLGAEHRAGKIKQMP